MMEMYENADSIWKYAFAMLCSLFIAGIYDAIKQRKQIRWIVRWITYVVISFPFAILIGLRRYDVGADTKNYVKMFYAPKNINKNLEFAYRKIVYFCNDIGDGNNYSVLLVLFSFLTLFFVLFAIEIMDKEASVTLALFLFFAFMGLNMTDQIRQMLAVSLFAVFVAFLNRKSYIYAGGILAIAVGIHTSIILAIGLLCIIRTLKLDSYVKVSVCNSVMYFRAKLMLCIIGVCLFIITSFPVVCSILFTYMLPKYKFYFDTAVEIKNMGMGFLLDMTMPLLAVVCTDKKKMDKKEGILYSFVFLTVIFRLLTYYSYFVGRMLLYMNIIGILLLTIMIKEYKKQKRRKMLILIVIFGIMYFIFNIRNYFESGHGAIPYYSIYD